MIIEFPQKYSVVHRQEFFTVSVPDQFRGEMVELLEKQQWIQFTISAADIMVFISKAYEITDKQTYDALCQLCEYIISPPVEVDEEVWGEIDTDTTAMIQ